MNRLVDWLPAVIGMLVAGATIWGGVWLKLRRREILGESAPQNERLLRPPGYHLQQEMETLDEKIVMTVIHIMASCAIAGMFLALSIRLVAMMIVKGASLGQLIAIPNGYLVVLSVPCGFVATAWAVAACLRLFRLLDITRAYRLGLRGEQATAEALHDSRLAVAGFHVFHDVPGDGRWNVDHVVVGPPGIFVIETKTCRRRKKKRYDQRDCDVVFDGRVLRFPWRCDDKAVAQVSDNARWLRKYIGEFSPDIRIQPVIVVPGWYVKSQGNYAVKVMNASYLVTEYLLKEPKLYKEEQLKGVRGRLDERCRTVEFSS